MRFEQYSQAHSQANTAECSQAAVWIALLSGILQGDPAIRASELVRLDGGRRRDGDRYSCAVLLKR